MVSNENIPVLKRLYSKNVVSTEMKHGLKDENGFPFI